MSELDAAIATELGEYAKFIVRQLLSPSRTTMTTERPMAATSNAAYAQGVLYRYIDWVLGELARELEQELNEQRSTNPA